MAKLQQNNENYTPEQLQGYINSSKLLVTSTFPAPPIVIKIEDSIVGTLGNFSASTGKAKSRKTFNVSAIAAASLSNKTVLKYSASLPSLQPIVVFIDTEQSKWHCKKVLDRIVKLAGYPENIQPNNLIFLSLRPFSPSQRIAIIDHVIENTDGIGLVVIDGVRDLAYDINSPQEATDVITKFMQWTDKKNIHIHTVLHQNKGDNNSRGHLGTELNNKCETVFDITVHEFDKELSVVSSAYMRDRDFEPFAFFVNEDILPELDPEFVSNKESRSNKKSILKPAEWSEAALMDHVTVSFALANEHSLSYKDCIKYFKLAKSMGENAAKKFHTYYVQNEYLVKDGTKYMLGSRVSLSEPVENALP